jgi:anion transporter
MFYTALATNVLAKSIVEDLGILHPTWIQWVQYFLPVGILLFLMVPVLTYLVYPPGIKSSATIPKWAREELAAMGPFSRKEIFMACLGGLALLLWIFGKHLHIHATLAALTVLCLMVLMNIITWKDILSNTPAWNVFLWFGAMVTLAGGLNNVGFLDWFATSITRVISNYSPDLMLVLLLLVFYFVHYLFASSTAHVAALLSIFLVTGSTIEGINFPLLLHLLLFSLGLMGVLTPYATGPSPIWYGLGYISTRTYWKLGALFGLVFIAALIFIGIPWMKIWI